MYFLRGARHGGERIGKFPGIDAVDLGHFRDGLKSREGAADTPHPTVDEHAGRSRLRGEHISDEQVKEGGRIHIQRIAQRAAAVFARTQRAM